MRRAAFTLIELLVTIAIVSLLVSVLLPVLGGARSRAATLRDESAMRQLATAVGLYADEHADAVIPGYLPGTNADGTALSVPIDGGDVVTGRPAQMWLFRLGPYFDFAYDGVTHVGTQGEVVQGQADLNGQSINRSTDPFLWYYTLAEFPSFGLNQDFVGGYWDVVPGGGLTTLVEGGRRPISPSMVVRRMSAASFPDRLILSASSRTRYFSSEPIPGYRRLTPPQLGEPWDASASPARFGFVDCRYGGAAVVGVLGGSVDLVRAEELLDRRRWAEPAARLNDAAWPLP